MPAHPKRIQPRYVLVIEDNVHHAELITEVMDRHFAPVVVHTVDTIEDGIEFAGQSSYDLIITGGVIRETPVANAIPRLGRQAGGTPIIVISGRGDERLAAELIKKGATEYLVKTRDTLENLHTLLEKHLSKKSQKKRARHKGPQNEVGSGTHLPQAIIREVDHITQQALGLAGSRRRKRRNASTDIEQLDHLLAQIQRLRQLALKLTPKE